MKDIPDPRLSDASPVVGKLGAQKEVVPFGTCSYYILRSCIKSRCKAGAEIILPTFVSHANGDWRTANGTGYFHCNRWFAVGEIGGGYGCRSRARYALQKRFILQLFSPEAVTAPIRHPHGRLSCGCDAVYSGRTFELYHRACVDGGATLASPRWSGFTEQLPSNFPKGCCHCQSSTRVR